MGVVQYVGSKQKLLGQIRPIIDPLLDCAEAFYDVTVGAGSVLLDVARRYPAMQLHANDADPEIAALWQVVVGDMDDLDELMGMVVGVEPTLELWDELQKGAWDRRVEQAFRVVYLSFTSWSGCLVARARGGRTQKCSHIDARWNPDLIDRKIHEARRLLRGRLTVRSLDVVDCLSDVPVDDGHVVYLDPPYYEKGPELYRHSMDHADHERLASGLAARRDWVLSYDNSVEIRSIYEWAHIREIYSTSTAARAHGARDRNPELLIVPQSHPVVVAQRREVG